MIGPNGIEAVDGCTLTHFVPLTMATCSHAFLALTQALVDHRGSPTSALNDCMSCASAAGEHF